MRWLFFVIAMFLTLPSTSAGEFVPESATDALDRLQILATKISQNSATVGSATLTNTNQPHLSKTFEWFVVAQQDGRSATSYSESRALYPHAPSSNVWERRYIADGHLFRSLGDVTSPLREVKKAKDQDEGKYLRTMSVGVPNMFSLALCGPSSVFVDMSQLQQVLNGYQCFEEQQEEDAIHAKFYGSNAVKVVTFSKSSAYLPTHVQNFFYTAKQRGAAPSDPSEYAIPWSETRVEWKKIDLEDDIWAPIRVEGVVYRINPNSNQGEEVEATANWELSMKENLLSRESIELLPIKGPVADLREHLLSSEQHRRSVR